MLRLVYLVFLYCWYGGSPSTLSEELPAESSFEGSAATSISPHVSHHHPSEENKTPEGHITPPAPATDSLSEELPAESSFEGSTATSISPHVSHHHPSEEIKTPEGYIIPLAPATDSQLQHQLTSPTVASLGEAERGVRPATSEQGNGGVYGGSGQGERREEERYQLYRVSIVDKLTPLTVLISFVSDLDVIADWYFFNQGLEGQTSIIFKVALAFTVIGTVMYVLLTLEFHPISKVRAVWAGKPLSPLQHVPLGWQLAANVVVEDIPQLAITCIASPESVAGVLNIATATFALMAKMAEGFATRKDLPMSSQLRMVEEDPGVVRHMIVQQRNADGQAAKGAKLAVLVNNCREERDPKRQRASAFEVMQLDSGFLNGSLKYVREILEVVEELDLSYCGLQGCIPSSLGDLTQLKSLRLDNNQLSGPIPPNLGDLARLTNLNLKSNKLSGSIPQALGKLTALRTLDLSWNQLTGSIPDNLGGLTALTTLNLTYNSITGSIPPALGKLVRLGSLVLSSNRLNGDIPPALGNLTALRQLSLSHNRLTGEMKGVRDMVPPDCDVRLYSTSK